MDVRFFLIYFIIALVLYEFLYIYGLIILAVKGRFRDYYRHGQVRSCVPYWNDFFLCMRLKLETNEEKARVTAHLFLVHY